MSLVSKTPRSLLVGERVLLSIWVGGMWVIGYLVAPFLFNNISERAVAGMLAGELIRIISYLGLGVLGLVWLRLIWERQRSVLRHALFWMVSVCVLALLVNIWFLYPEMAALKISGIQEGTENAQVFHRLHGISALLYLAVSLVGLCVVAFGVESEAL